MHHDAAYTVFFAFGIIWIILGIVAVVALLKLDNQPIRFGKWGILVASPIVVGIIVALGIAAILSQRS
ncbi:MAG TPA: hypothetical protein V6C57_17290 [Coleofasciculaceae cyanobacterium]